MKHLMNKKGQAPNPIIEWGVNAIILVIMFFVLLQIAKAFCETDSDFCKYGFWFIGAFAVGIYFYLRYGLRR